MIDAKAPILDILKNDDILKDMLPNNKSFKKMGDLDGETKLPVITFQLGPSVNLDENLFQNDLYLRVYDEPKMGTINISKIGKRIKDLLHKKEIPLNDGVFVKCKLNNTIGELEDQAFHKTFIEYQYRIFAI